jgi:hypothetical protein
MGPEEKAVLQTCAFIRAGDTMVTLDLERQGYKMWHLLQSIRRRECSEAFVPAKIGLITFWVSAQW